MRLIHLDILRAVAVLLVLGRHLIPCPADGNWMLAAVTRLWARGGWIGVDLFFVLSGFLVSGLLFREYKQRSTVNVGRFLLRRGLKIYPAFYLFLIVTLALRYLVGRAIDPWAIASETLFVQNYGPEFWNHTWSLAVEEHFYLLLAGLCSVLVLLMPDDPFRHLGWAFLALALGLLLLRVVTAWCIPFGMKSHLYPTHLRVDSLGFGVLLAYAYHFRPGALRSVAEARGVTLAVCTLLVLPAFILPVEHPFMHTVGLTFLYLGFGGLLIACLDIEMPESGTRRRALVAVGTLGAYSYSIYLWHMPVLSLGKRLAIWLADDPLPQYYIVLTSYVLGSFLFGMLMAKCVELPVLAFRDRFFPSNSADVPARTRTAPLVQELCGPVPIDHEPSTPNYFSDDHAVALCRGRL